MGFLYSMNIANEVDYSSINLFILACGADERSGAMTRILAEKSQSINKVLLLKYEDFDESILCTAFPEAEIIPLSVTGEQIEFLQNLQERTAIFENNNILIDITSIRIPEMFMLFKFFRMIDRENQLYVAYATPIEYEFQEEPFTSYRSYYGNLKTMDLIGYGGMSDDMSHSQFVVFIGFEGILSAKVNEDVRYSKLKLVNNLPSFYEKYKDICVINNYDLLASRHEKLSYVPANNPFETYNFLSEQLCEGETACIAPLSAKPVALGVCMYALDHENVRVVYPVADAYTPHRANSTHSVYVYDLTYSSE